MTHICNCLIMSEFFTLSDFAAVQARMVEAGIDPASVRYQFVRRTDLDGLPHMLYATAKVENQDNG